MTRTSITFIFCPNYALETFIGVLYNSYGGGKLATSTITSGGDAKNTELVLNAKL